MDISKLQAKKLLMDLKYWKEEFNIKKEIVNTLDILFNKEIENYLKDHKEAKEKWDDHLDSLNTRIDSLVKKEDVSVETEENENENDEDGGVKSNEIEKKPKEQKDPFLKQLYREIVKKTHPDKNKNLNKKELEDKTEIYKECTKAYDEDNVIDLLYHANNLNVDFDLKDTKIINDLENSLDGIKSKSTFIENTYTWKWYNADKDLKDQLISLYIQQTLK